MLPSPAPRAAQPRRTSIAGSGAERGRAGGGMTPRFLERKGRICCLDIFGFECFETNGFEQLCINYTNEKLQQYFIELTLKAEQEEYAKEGIAWQEVEFFDNLRVCELIEGKQNTKLPSIIAILDEEVIFPDATDASLHAKLHAELHSNQHFFADAEGFTIRHYAGDVRYSPAGMLEKNRCGKMQNT